MLATCNAQHLLCLDPAMAIMVAESGMQAAVLTWRLQSCILVFQMLEGHLEEMAKRNICSRYAYPQHWWMESE